MSRPAGAWVALSMLLGCAAAPDPGSRPDDDDVARDDDDALWDDDDAVEPFPQFTLLGRVTESESGETFSAELRVRHWLNIELGIGGCVQRLEYRGNVEPAGECAQCTRRLVVDAGSVVEDFAFEGASNCRHDLGDGSLRNVGESLLTAQDQLTTQGRAGWGDVLDVLLLPAGPVRASGTSLLRDERYTLEDAEASPMVEFGEGATARILLVEPTTGSLLDRSGLLQRIDPLDGRIPLSLVERDPAEGSPAILTHYVPWLFGGGLQRP